MFRHTVKRVPSNTSVFGRLPYTNELALRVGVPYANDGDWYGVDCWPNDDDDDEEPAETVDDRDDVIRSLNLLRSDGNGQWDTDGWMVYRHRRDRRGCGQLQGAYAGSLARSLVARCCLSARARCLLL
jgi:hypothetical protein